MVKNRNNKYGKINSKGELVELHIDENKWGTGSEGGFLLNPSNNKMCCWGFACKAFGHADSELLNKEMPCNIAFKGGEYNWATVEDADAATAAEINDSYTLTLAQRKKKISKIFADHGCKVDFYKS